MHIVNLVELPYICLGLGVRLAGREESTYFSFRLLTNIASCQQSDGNVLPFFYKLGCKCAEWPEVS
jgi:hypothetical protein